MSVVTHSDCPEGLGKVRLIEHSDNTFREGAVETFSNTVLLGCCMHSVLLLDTPSLAPVVKFLANVLTTLVILKSLDLHPMLGFRPGNKILEGTERIVFVPEEVYLFESREVVNEDDPVLELTYCLSLEWAMEVAVDETKKFG